LTVLALAAFAGRTTFSAFSHDAMLQRGVWRFAYTPYQAYRETVRADGNWYNADPPRFGRSGHCEA